MKKCIFISIGLLFCFFSLTGQKSGVFIQGKIENPQAKNIVIFPKYRVTIPGIIQKSVFSDTAQVDQEGNFSIQLKIDQPDYFIFRHAREMATLFFCPGDSLFLSLETGQFDETLKFKGRGADINNFLSQKFLFNEKLESRLSNIYKYNETEFVNKVDSFLSDNQLFMNNFLKFNKDINEKFLKYEKAIDLYSWANYRVNYPYMHQYATQDVNFKVSAKYDNYLNKVDINDLGLLEIEEFQSFLFSFFRDRALKRIEKTDGLKAKPNADTYYSYKEAQNLIKDPKMKNYVLFQILNDQISYKGIRGMDELVKEYLQTSEDQEYKKVIKESYDYWYPLREGVKALEFTYYDVDSNKVSFDDFKGKYVFIDVWATWCKPCIYEIPALKRLDEEFKGKNIVFLSVSVDNLSKYQVWKNMVKKEGLTGIHLFAGGFQSNIAKNYQINSIPRFMLFDKEGNIIDVNAPRPSSGARELLLSLKGI